MKVVFNKTSVDKEKLKYIKSAIYDDIDYIKKSTEILKKQFKVGQLLLTNSASSALELIIYSLAFEKDCEVIIPSFTYPSVANSIIRMGLKPILVEINKKTLVMSMDDVIKKTTKKTICIIACHYGGASIDMDKLMDYANKENIFVIEDAATAFGAKYKNKYLGTIGHAGVMSFDKTKNISSEAGGVLFINNLHNNIIRRIQINYDNGTNRKDFLLGKVGFYSWEEAGLSVKMSNIHATLLYSQLLEQDNILKNREEIYNYYYTNLKEICKKNNWETPFLEKYNKNNYHVFYIILNNIDERESLRKHLLGNSIHAHTHYYPLHLSTMGKRIGYKDSDLLITNEISKCLLRLPLHNNMDLIKVKYVIEKIREYR